MLKLAHPLAPMEALSVAEIPIGPQWQYEPKWDGFRCLTFREGAEVYLQSKGEKPLARYFPEVEEAVRALRKKRFVLDGELVVPVDGQFDFDQLLQRIHPAESRIRKLAAAHPAIYYVFDLLAGADGASLVGRPLVQRRALLEELAATIFRADDVVRLSPASRKVADARRWFKKAGVDVDGVIAKRLDAPYLPGERTEAVEKIKPVRSAECVVGGFRYGSKTRVVGSLLLGLYDDRQLLNHVGFTANIPPGERPRLTKKLERLAEPPGFTGQAPGGPSRWSTQRSTEWIPLAPKLVVEVAFDHFSGGRFRHGTSFLRWRPDKRPKQCTYAQLQKR